jgi:hypothetical protein
MVDRQVSLRWICPRTVGTGRIQRQRRHPPRLPRSAADAAIGCAEPCTDNGPDIARQDPAVCSDVPLRLSITPCEPRCPIPNHRYRDDLEQHPDRGEREPRAVMGGVALNAPPYRGPLTLVWAAAEPCHRKAAHLRPAAHHRAPGPERGPVLRYVGRHRAGHTHLAR